MRAPLCLLALSLVSIGCSEESRRCRAERDRAQEIVKAIDSKSQDSLTAAVGALSTAIDACDKAAMGADKSQLLEARNQIGAHLALLKRRAERKKAKLTPADLERLAREGDPTCPKGQGYKQGKHEIRCTGPELIDMSLDQANEYFSSRKYRITISKDPPTLRAEKGAEVYVFKYEKPDDTAGPKCLELFPIPGITLPEAVGRATGARLEKLKNGGTVTAARGELALTLEDGAQKFVAKIGDCG